MQCFVFVCAAFDKNDFSALQKSECYSVTSAAQHDENCSATSVFSCDMMQRGGGLGPAEK